MQKMLHISRLPILPLASMRPKIQFYFLFIASILGAIVLRLAYWQIIRGPSLSAQAKSQYSSKNIESGKRGEIISSDGSMLVINKPIYNLGVYLPGFSEIPANLPEIISSNLEYEIQDPAVATDAAKYLLTLNDLKDQTKNNIKERLNKGGYVTLAQNLSEEIKNKILSTSLVGLTFDPDFTREYPEASLSAHITGFVGKDEAGIPTGYFGLEGFYNRELVPRSRVEQLEKDALGNPLLTGSWELLPGRLGRTLKLHLDRSAQKIASSELAKGLAQYGATSGEVIIMDPKTGGILAMASLPTYDPAKFHLFDSSLYKNPAIANTYEPGSTFKVLVAGAALNEGVVDLSELCDICHEPVQIGKYSIKTWNGEYNPDSNIQDIIVHSDNTGMVWLERKLGNEKFLEYIQKFGFGKKTNIDLQEEVDAPLRTKWGDIDYATASFGQGLAVTSIQMVQAVGALANKGVMMQPHVVSEVIGESVIPIKPVVKERVISENAAQQITQIMVQAVELGEAKWARPYGYSVAGKTGTAQIAVSGQYDEQKTIASFVGFAPAYNPKFVMLVKLREPQSSQWGSETAAPLWFSIAKKLLLHYNIPPDRNE